MGKRYYRLWPELVSFENLYLAYRKAARGKRSKPAAAGANFTQRVKVRVFYGDLTRLRLPLVIR